MSISAVVEKRINSINLAAMSGEYAEAQKQYTVLLTSGKVSEEELNAALEKRPCGLDFLNKDNESKHLVSSSERAASVQSGSVVASVPTYGSRKSNRIEGYQPISATIENWAKFEGLAAALEVGRNDKQKFLSDLLDSWINSLSEKQKDVYDSERENRIRSKESKKGE